VGQPIVAASRLSGGPDKFESRSKGPASGPQKLSGAGDLVACDLTAFGHTGRHASFQLSVAKLATLISLLKIIWPLTCF
jgi:hypothetical protein